MKGRLQKTPKGWVINTIPNSKIWSSYIPLHPYHPNIEGLKDGYEVEYEVEKFWETGIETPLDVAKISFPFVSDDFQIGPDGAYEHTEFTELDKFHYHEFLDRLSLMGDIVDHSILKHPVCDETPGIKEMAEDVISKLVDLYQKVGEIRFKQEESESNNIMVKEKLVEIKSGIEKRIEEIKYKEADISDLGNEIGIIVGNSIENMKESQISDFVHGLKHGISLTNGTH